MNFSTKYLLFFILSFVLHSAQAQNIITVAGNGTWDFSKDGKSSTSTDLRDLNAVSVNNLDYRSSGFKLTETKNSSNSVSSDAAFTSTLNLVPSISSFTPTTGAVGTLVTISGTNLSSPTALTIGGVSAIPISNDGSTLVAMVMPGATTGTVSISTAGGTASGSGNFTVIPTNYPNTQQGGKLVGTGITGFAEQGLSVSVSADGNTAIVGGLDDNSAQGAVWVFTRSGSTWTQQGSKLVGTGNTGAAQQGISVSISADGNTAIVGGSSDNSSQGAAWVFTRSGSTWTQQGSKLVGTGSVGTLIYQGSSVSISADGNTAIVGGYRDNNWQGAAWVFTRSGSTWTQQGSKLVGTGGTGAAAYYQGFSVSISADGNTAIVGGFGDNDNQGAVWIYTRSGSTWTQQGAKLVGTGNADNAEQGYSVSISADGNTAIVGGAWDNNRQGAVWIFTRSGSTWTQQGSKLVGTGNIGAAFQGVSVSISADGNTAIVGGYFDYSIGAVWVFTRSGNIWTQQGSKLVGTGSIGISIYQGSSVSISADGNTVIVGGYRDNSYQGAAWVFVSGRINISGNLTSYSSCAGIASASQTFNISGDNLTANITVTAPSEYEISTSSGSGYGSTVSLTQSGGSVSNTTIYARLTSSATGSPSGNITAASSGVTTQSIAVTGTVNAIPATPTSSAGSATTFCAGGNVVLTSSAGSGNQWYKGGVLISGQTSTTYTASTSGNYTVISTQSGCCSAASSASSITVNAIPATPTISAGSAITFCAGGNVVLTSSAGSGNQWYAGGVLISGQTATTYTASTTGNYTVISTQSGCSSAASSASSVTVNAIPSTPTISAGSATTFCAGGSVVLTSSAGSGNQWYKGGVLISGQTATTYTSSATGNYTVISTQSGCSSAASSATTVTVNAIPSTPTISAGSATTFCSGGNVVLTSSAGSGNQWYAGGVILSGQTATTYTASTTGNYTVISTQSGCSSAASSATSVTVNAIPSTPTISAGSATTFCAAGNVVLTSSAGSGNQWYAGGVLISGQTATTYTALTTGNYTVISTQSGCSSAASSASSVTVNTIPSIPTISAGSATTFCAGGNVVLTSSAGSGNQWYAGGVILSGQTGTTYTASATGNYTVISTQSGCSSAASSASSVTVNAIPSIVLGEITGVTTTATSFTIPFNSTTGSPDQYSITTGATAMSGFTAVSNALLGGSPIAVNIPSSTTNIYDFNISVKNSSTGCVSSNTGFTLTVSNSPTIIVTGALSAFSSCLGLVSASQTVTVSGINLTANITITAPSGYEISTSSGSGYSSTVSLTQSGGSVSNTTIYARLTSSASGSPSGNITAASTGATTKNIAVTGTVNAIPATPSISAGSAITFCAGGSVVLTSSASSSNQWYAGGVLISGQTSTTYTASATGNYTVISTQSGCSSAASTATSVTVNAIPSITLGTLSEVGTSATSFSIPYTATTGSPNQYSITTGVIALSSFSTVSHVALGSSPVIVTIPASSPGTYDFNITVNNSSTGCTSNIVPFTLTVSSATAINTSGGLSAYSSCAGIASAAQAFTVGGINLSSNITVTSPSGYEVSTSPGSGYSNTLILTQSGGTVNTTTIYVRLTNSASGNPSGNITCTSAGVTAQNIAVTGIVNAIPATPTITAGGATTFCTGGLVVLTSSASSGNQWYDGGILLSGAIGNTYTALATGNYTVITTQSGCSSAASSAASVTVNAIPAIPTISAGSATTFCAAGTVVLTSSALSGNQWYEGGVLISGQTATTYIASASGNYTVITTQSGCSSAASSATSVTVNAIPSTPTISAGSATTFCSGGSIVLTSNAGSGNQWYAAGVILSGQTGTTYIVSTTGIYSVVTKNGNCLSAVSASTTVTVTPIPAQPTTFIKSAASVCQAQSNVIYSVANDPTVTYNWTYSGAGATITGSANAVSVGFINTATNGNISVTATNTCGTSSALLIPVTVHVLPNTDFLLPIICLPGGKGVFSNTSTISDGTQNLFSYLWNFNDPSDPTPSTLENPIHYFSGTGPYNILLTITTINGCQQSKTKLLNTIYQSPKSSFETSAQAGCVNDMISFTDQSVGFSSNINKWFWDLGNGNSSIQQNLIMQYTDSGAFYISLYVIDLNGCISDSVVKQINIYPYPKLLMNSPQLVPINVPFHLMPQFYYGNNLSFLWSPSLYLDSTRTVNPICKPLDDITYTLTLTESGLCSISNQLSILVLREPVTPNAFSPNGDGINDLWIIKYLDRYPGASVSIFDRYGMQVFYSTNFTNWDGRFNNQPLPIGTYYYIINLNNGSKPISGAITILR